VFALRGSFAPQPAASAVGPDSGGNWALVLHAAMAGTLNPKVAVFFLAFLPQFVNPERGSVMAQFLVLGSVLSLIALSWDSIVATLIGRARGRFAVSPRFAGWRERVTGLVLLGLGLRLAVSER
jgi:threonine/homoserine/homoserine lactone efflux protein